MKLFAATGDAVARVVGSEVTVALEGLGVGCVATDGRRVFAGTSDHGLYRSLDGGDTWEPVGPGIPHPRVLSVTVSPADGAVFAGTEPSLVCRSGDDGDTWETYPSMLELPFGSHVVVPAESLDPPHPMDRTPPHRRGHLDSGGRVGGRVGGRDLQPRPGEGGRDAGVRRRSRGGRRLAVA